MAAIFVNMKFLFTADWHLGKELYGKRFIKNNFYKAANAVIDLAIAEGVTRIFNAGDLLDTPNPSEETMSVLKQLQAKMLEHKIIMYVISGNHDFPGRAANWCQIVSDESSDYGFKFITDLPYLFSKQAILKFADENDMEKFALFGTLMLHTPVQDFNNLKFDRYLTLQELSDSLSRFSNLEHVIVGDTHKALDITIGNIHFISPGSIELVSANEDSVKKVYIYDTDSKIGKWQTLAIDYLRIIKTTDVLKSSGDIDRFISDIVSNNNVEDLKNKNVLCILKCNSQLSAEAHRRIYSFFTDNLKNNNEVVVHIVIKDDSSSINDAQMVSAVAKLASVDIGSDENFMSFDKFFDANIDDIQDKELCNILHTAIQRDTKNEKLSNMLHAYLKG